MERVSSIEKCNQWSCVNQRSNCHRLFASWSAAVIVHVALVRRQVLRSGRGSGKFFEGCQHIDSGILPKPVRKYSASRLGIRQFLTSRPLPQTSVQFLRKFNRARNHAHMYYPSVLRCQFCIALVLTVGAVR
jgi:hypothetical protein